ncbi:hypothetical protein L596_023190 [Steinernema carpocapsae]|uniref:Uncharacterized protein n=1 Tax=Steinernema carpocapsae TaxID=34508 RepID=A0A4U5MCX6_STECR|nr:hypothetical protein L596_023190 [Steinernema carpocapsae]
MGGFKPLIEQSLYQDVSSHTASIFEAMRQAGKTLKLKLSHFVLHLMVLFSTLTNLEKWSFTKLTDLYRSSLEENTCISKNRQNHRIGIPTKSGVSGFEKCKTED